MRLTMMTLAAAAIALPGAARADDAPCFDRPGLGTPACTAEPGRPMAELGLAAWDHSDDAITRDDTLTIGDLLLRFGLDRQSEVAIGITSLVIDRQRDKASGAVTRTSGVGDAVIAYKHGLSGAGGPVAVQAFITLPTGRNGIGAGDWGAGVLVPAAITLPHGFELNLTPELDAAVNASGSGRHFAWGGVIGLSHDVAPKLSGEIELGAWRDLDPAGHSTDARLALSAARQIGADWQVDVEADFGLTAAAPNHSLMIGLARRF